MRNRGKRTLGALLAAALPLGTEQRGNSEYQDVVAGIDLAGVHLYGQSLADTALSYKSSAISAIDGWKSPVYLLQGDDDRKVDFSQMIGLVQLLRAHNVYYELTVIPDDQHESMIHGNWIKTFGEMGDFLHRFVWEKQTPPLPH